MSEKLYKYNGPVTSVNLGNGEGVTLTPGQEVTLPADDEYVKTLVALNRLTEVPKKTQAGKNRATVSEEVNNAS
jgi:hypothetical protein